MFEEFSEKQLRVLTWWCEGSDKKEFDAIICDGAVRSGKTTCMSVSFVAWAFYRFQNVSFALCGKTIASLKRNLITPLIPILQELGFRCHLISSQNLLEISRDTVVNRFYLFGGRDESSASLIQGMTLAGVFMDEVALMPRSFVEQALARCSLSGSKFWFNCNPEHPLHWFHQEWIKKAKQKHAYYIHFSMKDNPSLSPAILKRYESLYSGAFYQRFVEGKWVAATGLVYPMFSPEKHIRPQPNEPCEEYYVSCDYGTVNPSSFGLWGYSSGVWYRIGEYYHNSRITNIQRTDEEYYTSLEQLIDGRRVTAVIVDPSAASFMECIRRHGRYPVIPAKNDVSDGIRKVSDALKSEKILFCDCCKDTIREFSLYRWDERSIKDTPVKENDHAMDDIRYFVMQVLSEDTGSFFAIAADRSGGGW